ncbi:MAG: hypothetical protein SF162_13485 [bacterium]|nr:hypothetical protein [bacterium]
MNTATTARRHLILAAFVMILAIIACDCTSDNAMACANESFQINVFNGVGFSAVGVDECIIAVDAACPDAIDLPEAEAAETACEAAALQAWKSGQPMPAADYPHVQNFPDPFAGGNSLVAPPIDLGSTPTPAFVPSVNCAPFAITAPNDGLPNGSIDIAWTQPTANVPLSYRITYFGENGVYLGTFISPTNGFVTADVSQAAIGGAYQITIQIDALYAGTGNQVCTTARSYLREANAPQNPGSAPAQRPIIVVPILPTIEPPR